MERLIRCEPCEIINNKNKSISRGSVMIKTSNLSKASYKYSIAWSAIQLQKRLRGKLSLAANFLLATATLLGTHASYAATDACTTSDGGQTYACSTQSDAQTQTITAPAGGTTVSIGSGSSIVYQSSQTDGIIATGVANSIIFQSLSASNLLDVQSTSGNIFTGSTTTAAITIGGAGSFLGTLKAIGGDGFNLSSSSGAITVNNAASLTLKGNGIITSSTTGGNISITNSGNISALVGSTGNGLKATTTGAGTIAVNNSGSLGGTRRLGSNGVEVTVNGSGATGTINVTNTGAILSTASGINATAVNGAITITNSASINTSASYADGIIANTTGGGAISITNQAGGDIVTNHHAIHGYGNPSSVSIINNATLSAKDTAIFGDTTGTNADVTITNTGSVTSRGSDTSDSDGIRVNSKRNATITNNGVVTAYTSAISVYNVGTGTTSITNTGSLLGKGASPQSSVIAIDRGASGNATATTINNSGIIAASSSALDAYAIAAGSLTDGAVTITNSGALTGRVKLTDNATAGIYDSFTNSGTWNTSGTSNFYIGADVITNTSTGRINTYGTTSFDMGGQTPVFENTFNNQGVLKVNNGVDGSAGVLNIFSTGNETLKFVNGGTIDLTNGGIGKPTNQLIINGNVYVEPSSNIVIDVPQGNSTSNIVVNGDVSGGKTDIVVVPETVGSNNPIGSAVVSIQGSDNSSGFAISPSSPNFYFNNGTALVNAGLYYEYLGKSTGGPSCANGYTCYSLYSIASAAARTLPIAVTAAQSLWQETSLMWEDRQVELRDSTHAHVAGSSQDIPCDDQKNRNGCGISTWLKSVGAWSNRSNNQTHFGGNGAAFSYDLGYRQNMFGMLGGAEWSKIGLFSKRDFFAVGIMGGYLQSNVGFNQEAGNMYGSSNFSYQGGTLGGSVTYMNNGLFADALFKTDLLGLNMTLPIGSLRNAAIGVRTAGGVGNLGYRYDFGSMFIEPLATLTYSTTGMGSINSLAYQNVGIGFGSGRDFRGGFGGRFGTSWANILSSHVLEASLTGRYWNMLNSNAGRTVDIMSSGVGETIGDYTLGRDYGDVKGNLNLFSICSGWSAFVNTGVKWNNQFTTVTTKGGIAYRW